MFSSSRSFRSFGTQRDMSFAETSMDEKIDTSVDHSKTEARLEQAKGHGLGSLVATVDEARAEYGDDFASKLKLADGGSCPSQPSTSASADVCTTRRCDCSYSSTE